MPSVGALAARNRTGFPLQNWTGKAQKGQRFTDEIVTVQVPVKGGFQDFAVDEYLRAEITVNIGQLKPAFKKDETVTAGNASGINQEVAALVLASREKVEKLQLAPFARIFGGMTQALRE